MRWVTGFLVTALLMGLAVPGWGVAGAAMSSPGNAVSPGTVKGVLGAETEKEKKKKDLEQKQAAAKQKEAELLASLEGVNADMAELVIQLERTKAAIPIAQEELAAAKEKLTVATSEHQAIQLRLELAKAQAKQLQVQIEAGQQVISRTQVTIGQIARQAYRGGQYEVSPWTLLLDSDSVEELGLRLQVADTAAQSQTQVILRAQEANAANQNARARQEAVTVRIGELETQAKQAVATAEEARKEQASHLASIQTLESQQVAQQVKLNAQRSYFERQIQEEKAAQALAAQQIAALTQQAQAGPSRTVNGGIFGAPLSSLNVTSRFGYRNHPVLGTRLWHAGTDFGMGCGQPVYAAQSGTTSFTHNSVGGNVLWINHGKINGSTWQTGYAHLSQYKVAAGAAVQKGQLVALVGTTGRSTGCHLHFEIWQNGKTIDPMGQL